MAKRTISAGNFSNGIVTDVIGATDSMVDIVDGWVPRIGEIRKRGGKSLVGATAPFMKRGTNNGAGMAFVGSNQWYVRTGTSTFANLNASRQVQLTPFASLDDLFYGGGDQIIGYGEESISVGQRAAEPAVSSIGKWGGALTSILPSNGSITLKRGSTTVIGATVGNYQIGEYVRFLAGPAPTVNELNRFRIVDIRDDEIYIDRPWPAVGASTYTIQALGTIIPLSDPFETGVNGAWAIETHQDRLFAANMNPSYVIDGVDVTGRETLPSRVRWSAVFSENGGGDREDELCIYGEHLWYEKGFADVFPGVGGQITNMHSLGNELLIIKTDATYSLRGSVSSQGFPSGATLDVINNDIGTPSFRGAAKTEMGVALANLRGLWVYNGGQMVNLIDETAERMWSQTFTDFSDIVVSGANERIIVQQPGLEWAWVYDMSKQHHIRQRCNPHTNVVAGDGDEEFAIDTVTGNAVDWSTDFSEINVVDSENANYPRLTIQTQPMPADSEPFFTARPNLLLVGAHTDTPLNASIFYGRQEFFETAFDVDTQVAPDSLVPLEYGVEAIDYDFVHRIPIGGIASRAAHRILIEQQDPATRVRIYGIGIEYLGDFTVGEQDD